LNRFRTKEPTDRERDCIAKMISSASGWMRTATRIRESESSSTRVPAFKHNRTKNVPSPRHQQRPIR
jgi:hypothetical protein